MGKTPIVSLWSNPAIVLFHGTTNNHVASILAGVNVAFGRGNDFGPGFYTTTNKAQARRWTRLTAARFGGNAAVIRFTVDREDLAKLAFMGFVRKESGATDFWNLVRHCRLRGPDHGRPGKDKLYDVVIGAVAKQWWRRKVAFRNYDQISFHTSAGADLLDGSSPKEIA